MNERHNIALLIFILLLAVWNKPAQAQQDPMYTQYMENLLVVNPGFAGSKGTGNFMVVARNQWTSFPGAPQTRTFSFHSPVNPKVGVGFSILTDKIGPLSQTGLYFDYSYQLRVAEEFRLAMGLKGGFSFYRAGLTELKTVNPDPVYSQDVYKNFLPNFGVGAYLYSADTYLGLSVPKLVENTISRDSYSSEYIGKQDIHIYMVAGKEIQVNESFEVKGHSMLAVIRNAPVSLDLTTMAGFKEKFWAGGMLRFGNSWGLLAQVKPTDQLLIGYSYDVAYSQLNSFNSGTHEIMLSYNISVFGK